MKRQFVNTSVSEVSIKRRKLNSSVDKEKENKKVLPKTLVEDFSRSNDTSLQIPPCKEISDQLIIKTTCKSLKIEYAQQKDCITLTKTSESIKAPPQITNSQSKIEFDQKILASLQKNKNINPISPQNLKTTKNVYKKDTTISDALNLEKYSEHRKQLLLAKEKDKPSDISQADKQDIDLKQENLHIYANKNENEVKPDNIKPDENTQPQIDNGESQTDNIKPDENTQPQTDNTQPETDNIKPDENTQPQIDNGESQTDDKKIDENKRTSENLTSPLAGSKNEEIEGPIDEKKPVTIQNVFTTLMATNQTKNTTPKKKKQEKSAIQKLRQSPVQLTNQSHPNTQSESYIKKLPMLSNPPQNKSTIPISSSPENLFYEADGSGKIRGQETPKKTADPVPSYLQKSQKTNNNTTKKTYDKNSRKNFKIHTQHNLTSTQKKILEKIVNDGENLLFIGSAGTGKSYLIGEIAKQLKKIGKNVEITASTGIAAVQIKGTTLHRFAGIGVSNTIESMKHRIFSSWETKKKWKKVDVLIIDEISMISSQFFDNLEMKLKFEIYDTESKKKTKDIARQVRECQIPFGGIQLVLCGDFYQLPPVEGTYCFEAESFKNCVPFVYELSAIFRQKDSNFKQILNEIRVGNCNENATNILNECRRELNINDGILPTELYTINSEVGKYQSKMILNLENVGTIIIVNT